MGHGVDTCPMCFLLCALVVLAVHTGGTRCSHWWQSMSTTLEGDVSMIIDWPMSRIWFYPDSLCIPKATTSCRREKQTNRLPQVPFLILRFNLEEQ